MIFIACKLYCPFILGSHLKSANREVFFILSPKAGDNFYFNYDSNGRSSMIQTSLSPKTIHSATVIYVKFSAATKTLAH